MTNTKGSEAARASLDSKPLAKITQDPTLFSCQALVSNRFLGSGVKLPQKNKFADQQVMAKTTSRWVLDQVINDSCRLSDGSNNEIKGSLSKKQSTHDT